MGKLIVTVKSPTQHKYKCCVTRCNSDERKNLLKYPWMRNVSFHSFPHKRFKQKERAHWINLIRREGFTPNKESRVCSLHFVGGRGPTEENPYPTLFPYNNYKLPESAFRSPNALNKRSNYTVQQSSEHTKLESGSSPSFDLSLIGPCEDELSADEHYKYVAGEICVPQSPQHDECSAPKAAEMVISTEAPNADHQYCASLLNPAYQDTSPEKQTVAVQTMLTMKDLDQILEANKEAASLQAKMDSKTALVKRLKDSLYIRLKRVSQVNY